MKEQTLKLDQEVAKGLSEKEFGIRQGAKFIPLEDSKLQVSKEGIVTLTYKIENTNDIIEGPRELGEVPFHVFGAFDKNEKDQFKEGSIPSVLRLRTTPAPAKQVILKSPGDAILAVTKARKIEHGSKLVERPLSEKEFGIRQGAKFIPLEDSKLQVSKEGIVTLTYKIENTNDIIEGPRELGEVPFHVFGAFDKNEKDQFKEGSIPSVLKLETTMIPAKQVILKSPGDAILAVTKAELR